MPISRIAPTGSVVDLVVPAALGALRWYGSTRFTGPRLARHFFLAPAGEHQVIPRKLLPGAREQRIPMRGYDAVLFEAADRSDAALALVGPFHEATTWFGGPAPGPRGIDNLISTFRFTDAAGGASLVPASDLLVRQSGVSVIGRSDHALVSVREAAEALPSLPEWAGLAVAGGELWRTGRALEPAVASLVADTAHAWRYLLAGPSAVTDVVLLGPESGRPAIGLAEDAVVAALSALTARWTR
ncbi:hypothetical protein ACQEVB_20365 [Pseudonocardia sp. CA-107938]|uniref:hypothetical protein n=1 Tax=Pseudonocardia sp. CA-107938 TaxID=3240021 RepID=UPI003D8E1D83